VTKPLENDIEFDESTLVAIAESLEPVAPGPHVKARLMANLGDAPSTSAKATADKGIPRGFALSTASEGWFTHPLPGIRMKVLAVSRSRGVATLLIDAAPGARFPEHHHNGDEECYVISGDVNTLGRRLGPGDFLHADEGTDHGELFTETGALVLLVVRPQDYIPGFA
jgi:anti-sigma factor ChrR (cupin superfamily)